MVGLVLYISSINDEILNRTKDSETYFSYKYGWSFAFAAISFLLTEVTGGYSVGLELALGEVTHLLPLFCMTRFTALGFCR